MALGAGLAGNGGQSASVVNGSSIATNRVPVSNGSNGYAWDSTLPDGILTSFHLANSGAVGTTTTSSGDANDHTALIQAYINSVQAIAATISSRAVAVIDCPALCYRIQNLVIPANVKLRGNGTRFAYVNASQNPATGPGNYVFILSDSYGGLDGEMYINGNGATQAGIGGVWLTPAGGTGSGSNRSYQKRIGRGVKFENFAGRAVFDQGVANHIEAPVAINCLLGATSIQHFMGVIEQAGTDGYLNDGEISASVTAGNGNVLNGIAVPRCLTLYDAPALTTTNGAITLPLSSGTITLTSASSLSTTGGYISIGGHLITYSGVSGANLTGCNCADSATITTGTNVYPVMGYVAAGLIAGANNWSTMTDYEISDIGLVLGPSVYAHVATGATLAVTPNQTLVVDNPYAFPTGGATCAVPNGTGGLPNFTYTLISETTLGAQATLNQTPQSLLVGSTTNWPASGSFIANGYTVTYTSIVDGTHLGGCTIASGSLTLANGTYIRSTALQNCGVASSTLVVSAGNAIVSTSAATQTKMLSPRIDLNMGHGVFVLSGSGEITAAESLRNGVTATNTYDAFHAVNTGASSFNFTTPVADSSSATNRMRFVINDQESSGTNFNRWIKPRNVNTFSGYFTGNTAGGWFDLAHGPGVQLSGATPSVMDLCDIVLNNGGATTVTNFTSGVNGQEISVLIDTNTTIANNSTIVTKSGANISPGTGYQLLRFKKIGYGVTPTPAWYQI